jgi:hypothetical protein
MKRTFQVFAICTILASPLYAQQRSDFSGTWTMDLARSESPKADDPSPHTPQATPRTPDEPTMLFITQNDREMQVETRKGSRAVTARYPMHDAANPRPVGTSGGGVGTVLRWEGDTLVTMTPHMINGMAVTTVERRSLSSDGNEMTVVTTVQVQHGYETGESSSPPAKDIYRRVRH